MTWTGRQLKDLGVPQALIKFFVGREYDSEAALLAAARDFKNPAAKSDAEKEQDRLTRDDPDCAFQVLWRLQLFPWSVQAGGTSPSRREVRQWLADGAVRVNGAFPKPWEKVEFPITDLVYFPGAKRQTTMSG